MIKYINKINEKKNIFKDDISYVEQWDFSRANLNEESRIEAITQVASVCYANPNVIGKESLYNRLKAESMGLPSSSFEFVPVLLTQEQATLINRAWQNSSSDIQTDNYPNTVKYSEIISDKNDNIMILTNYRALLSDYEVFKDYLDEDITQWFNTEEECNIIKDNFKVFLSKLDVVTRTQYIRHRVNWQELSRRYVSGKKVDFEFYITDGMKNVNIKYYTDELPNGSPDIDSYELMDMCLAFYFEALKQGVQPQEARRILPQAMYSTLWSAWYPKQLNNFFNLRLDKHAQQEIRWLAEAKKELLNPSII